MNVIFEKKKQRGDFLITIKIFFKSNSIFQKKIFYIQNSLTQTFLNIDNDFMLK